MKILEGINKIFHGNKAFERHLSLFSLCGIFGVLNVCYLSDGIEGLDSFQAICYTLLWIIFSVYIIGYEVLFLNERELPDVDFRPFNLIMKKPLIYFLLFVIPMSIVKFFPEYASAAFFVELLLAVPLTMIQAGYSYHFEEDESYKFFENSSFKDFFALVFKRLWLFMCSYIVVSLVVFVLFFIVGIIAVIAYKGNIENLIFNIISHRLIISKLSGIIGGVLLTYVLTISTLVWDYELIKTYEKACSVL